MNSIATIQRFATKAGSGFVAVQKAAVAALSSLFGTSGTQLTRALRRPHEPYAGAWQRGIVADSIEDLTTNGAVYACISRISNDIAKLALQLVKKQGKRWELADPKSPFWKPLRKPNNYQNRIQFIAYWLVCKLLHGNAYALKARDERGMVAKLYLVDPRMVTPLITSEGDVYYRINCDQLAGIPNGVTVPASEIIHDRINCLWHPLVGIAPILACAVSATEAIRIQGNSAKFFENMSRPSGILTAPDQISDEVADRLKRDWEGNFSGGNIGRLAVLGDGLKYEPMTIPAQQAQLIEQLDWTVADVARVFQVPLYKIGAGQMPTNNNVEALNQQYYDDCLQVHMEAIELCMNEGCGVPDDMGIEFDLTGLLRMDQSAQMKMLTEGVKGAVVTPNEARGRMNLPPLAGGDTVYLQHQNYSLEALAKRDAREDPFASSPAPSPAPASTPDPEPAPEDDKAARAVAKLLETIEKGLEHV